MALYKQLIKYVNLKILFKHHYKHRKGFSAPFPGALTILYLLGKNLVFKYRPPFLMMYTIIMDKANKDSKASGEQTKYQLHQRVAAIETEVLVKVEKLKELRKVDLCPQHALSQPEAPPYDPNVDYHDLFWKRFLLNQQGLQLAKKLEEENSNTAKELQKIGKLFVKRHAKVRKATALIKKESKDAGWFECTECKKTFRSILGLSIHQRTHSKPAQGSGPNKKEGESPPEPPEGDWLNISPF